jgi:hypothetical protein
MWQKITSQSVTNHKRVTRQPALGVRVLPGLINSHPDPYPDDPYPATRRVGNCMTLTKDYTPKVTERTKIEWKDSHLVHPTVSNDIYWRVDEFFLDLLICRGRDTCLSALLPNVNVHHGYEFELKLKPSPRTFSPKHTHLGFDPCGAMHYFGRTHLAEDAWIEWIPIEALGSFPGDEECVAPGTCSSGTHLSKQHFNGMFVFFAGLLHDMGNRDISVWDTYPDIDDEEAVKYATNLGCVIHFPRLRLYSAAVHHSGNSGDFDQVAIVRQSLEVVQRP